MCIVFKKIKCSNKVMLSFTVCLGLVIVSKIGFFILMIILYYNIHLLVNGQPYVEIPKFVITLVPKLSLIMLIISITLNLNLWVRYYFKIGIMAASVGFDSMNKNDQLRIKRIIRFVDTATVLFISLLVSLMVWITIESEESYEDEEDELEKKDH